MNLIYMVFKHNVVFRHQYISQSKLTTTSYLFCLESSIHIHSSLSWSLKWHTSPIHWQPSFFLEQRTFKFSTLCWSFLSTNEVNQRGHGLSATLTQQMHGSQDGRTDWSVRAWANTIYEWTTLPTCAEHNNSYLTKQSYFLFYTCVLACIK